MTSDQIKRELMKAGLYPKDIAKKAKCSRSMVSHVLAGKHPKSRVRPIIAKAIKKPVDKVWPTKGTKAA